MELVIRDVTRNMKKEAIGSLVTPVCIYKVTQPCNPEACNLQLSLLSAILMLIFSKRKPQKQVIEKQQC
jgi:hypothetical protein